MTYLFDRSGRLCKFAITALFIFMLAAPAWGAGGACKLIINIGSAAAADWAAGHAEGARSPKRWEHIYGSMSRATAGVLRDDMEALPDATLRVLSRIDVMYITDQLDAQAAVEAYLQILLLDLGFKIEEVQDLIPGLVGDS